MRAFVQHPFVRLSAHARYCAFGLAVFAVLTVKAWGQGQYPSQVPTSPSASSASQTPNAHILTLPQNDHEPTGDPDKMRQEAARLKYANDERHKKLVADTEKLLALATELKAEVDKANKDELSVTVVKRAGEMEKLAHDVKQRMTN